MGIRNMAAAAFAGILSTTVSVNASALDLTAEMKENPQGVQSMACAIILTSAANNPLVGKELVEKYKRAAVSAMNVGAAAYGSMDVFLIKMAPVAVQYGRESSQFSITSQEGLDFRAKEIGGADNCAKAYGIK